MPVEIKRHHYQRSGVAADGPRLDMERQPHGCIQSHEPDGAVRLHAGTTLQRYGSVPAKSKKTAGADLPAVSFISKKAGPICLC